MRLEYRSLILACIAWCLLALVACGLEPRYALPPPERDDRAFRWIDAITAPPSDYVPVLFSNLETEQRLAVCRGFIVDDPEPDQGYHTGELGLGEDGAPECHVPHRGELLRFHTYQQLWARSDAVYHWVALANFPERPLVYSDLWLSNRIPGDFVRLIATDNPVEYWMPCAALREGMWHLGKLDLRNGDPIPCLIEIAEREVAAYADIRVLYAPVP